MHIFITRRNEKGISYKSQSSLKCSKFASFENDLFEENN